MKNLPYVLPSYLSVILILYYIYQVWTYFNSKSLFSQPLNYFFDKRSNAHYKHICLLLMLTQTQQTEQSYDIFIVTFLCSVSLHFQNRTERKAYCGDCFVHVNSLNGIQTISTWNEPQFVFCMLKNTFFCSL